MPHLVLEYAIEQELPIAFLDHVLSELVRVFCVFETIDPKAVKARALGAVAWTQGEGCESQQVHLQIKLIEGRPEELLSRMADELFAVLKKEFDSIPDVNITLLISEMKRVTFRK